MKRLSRLDESPFARLWWSIDRPSLAILALIVIIGFVVLMAAGPAAASRIRGVSEFDFPLRQLIFLAPTIFIILTLSFLTPLQARRLGVLVFLAALVAMVGILLFAGEVNGAKRWFYFAGFSLQPSEFAKPGFVIVAAWMLAEGSRDPKFPGGAIAIGLYAVFAGLLLAQPDYGQWALVTAAWAVMFFVAGWSWLWIAGLGVTSVAALSAGYVFSDHVAARVDGFLNPAGGVDDQVHLSVKTISNGGLLGRGDTAAVKGQLPDSHSDFIFAVANEEFGFVLGVLIILLFAAFTARVMAVASGLKSVFAQCAATGLAALIGFQAIINIGVSIRALPAKGMTLPFVSYGGSSLLAMGLTVGLIFALTRTHQGVFRRKDIMP